MWRGLIFALILACSGQNAAAAAMRRIEGAGALALAALVGLRSPRLSTRDKRDLAALFNDAPAAGMRARDIRVVATSVICRASDVDIAAHKCVLAFEGVKRTLKGRRAHELYATLIEVGAPPEGAAGSIDESLSKLVCRVAPREVLARAGGGASCEFARER